MFGYGGCGEYRGGSRQSSLLVGVLSVSTFINLRFMIGFFRPENLGTTYKTLVFGDNEPYRIRLPPSVEQVFERLSQGWMVKVPRFLALVSPFVVMWDYKWFHVQQSPGSQVEGLWEYRELQLLVLVIRFLAWGMTRWTKDAVLTMWLSGFLGIISLVVGTLH